MRAAPAVRRVYTWGRGARGELGHGAARRDENAPRVVAALRAVRVAQLAAGEQHCACLTEPEMVHVPARVYVWGAYHGAPAARGGAPLDGDVPRLLPLAASVLLITCGGGATLLTFATPPPDEQPLAAAPAAAASAAAAKAAPKLRHRSGRVGIDCISNQRDLRREWSSVPLARWKLAVRLAAKQRPSPELLRAAERIPSCGLEPLTH